MPPASSPDPHGLTSEAERFAAALDVVAGRRRRLSIDDCFEAFYELSALNVDAPDKRVRLAELLARCEAAGVVELSASRDRGTPPLPRSIQRTGAEPRTRATATLDWPWRAELAWASELALTAGEFEVLKAVQEFLRGGGPARPSLGHRERSLELFGDEKELDRLVRTRLFADGRLSLALLRCRWAPPPLAMQRVGPGPIALVLENADTWHSCLATLRRDSPVGVVAYGGGHAFIASVASLVEVRGIGAIHYAGDLDAAGLAIPIAADSTRLIHRLPPILPAASLWRLLLQRGRRAPAVPVQPEVTAELVGWLPADLRLHAGDVLIGGHRMAQEAVTAELLSANPGWDERLE